MLWHDFKLGRFIDNNQSDEFVNHYIKCLNDKYQLTLPVSMDAEELNAKWESVLARFRADFSMSLQSSVSKMAFFIGKIIQFKLNWILTARLSMDDIAKMKRLH